MHTIFPVTYDLRNMVVLTVVLAATWGAFAALFLLATPLDGAAVRTGAWLGLGAVVALDLLRVVTRGIRARGRTVLDCGARSWAWVGWAGAAVVLLPGVVQMPDGLGTVELTLPGGELWAAALGIGFAMAHLKVTENGVWAYWTLIPWNRIEAWERNDRIVLHLSQEEEPESWLRRVRWISGPVHLSVPQQHREAFIEHLERNGVPRVRGDA